MLKFRSKPQIKDNGCAIRHRYISRSGRLALTHVRSTLRSIGGAAGNYWLAERVEATPTGECWEIISRHRSRRAAEAGCEKWLGQTLRRSNDR
jgi:hypothetical protein